LLTVKKAATKCPGQDVKLPKRLYKKGTMKLITRDTDYAVRALCFIAGNSKKIVAVPELVKETKIPRPFLRKILQKLHKNGVLRAYKGKGGGFELALAPQKIMLVDLVKIFQGPFSLNECIFKKKVCPGRNACVLKSKIDNIERQVIRELSNIALSSLM